MTQNMILVVIPAFNSEKTIQFSVESVLKQTHKNIKVIVVDDCSEDGTVNLLKSIKSQDSRMDYIMLRKNIGTYQAINIALNSCKEFDYFTIHGSDDSMDEDKIEKQISSIESNRSLASISGYRRINLSDGKILYSMKSGESMVVYKKIVFDELGYYDNTRFGGDSEYLERFKAKYGEQALAKVEEILSNCYITGNNLSKNKFPLNSIDRKNYVKKYGTEIEQMKNLNIFKRDFIRKKTICFFTCTYKREHISVIFKNKLIELQSQFEDYDFINLVVDSEWSNSSVFQKDDRFIYTNFDNSPLSDKWNFGLEQIKNLFFDYLILIGSDDIISPDVFRIYLQKIEENFEFIGIEDLFMYDLESKSMYYWPGYNNERRGETTGLGRCLSKSVVEKMNYELWNNGLERNLDGSMMSKLKNSNLIQRSFTFKCKDIGYCVDIKSDQNLTNINRFKNLEIIYQHDFEI